MALETIEAVVNDACDAVVGRVDGGKIVFYSGTKPAIGAAATGTLLAEVDFEATAFGASANGSAAAAGVPLETTGVGDGDIGYARVLNSADAVQWQTDDVGTSDTEITVNTVTVSTGVNFSVTSYTFSVSYPG